MPMPMQLALQGGGAKLMALFAAMEAVQELDGGAIQVTRLAGTSAGAIVACLYGAGVKMEDAKTEFVNAFKGKVSSLFRPPGNLGFGWNIYKRREIWSTEPVEAVLTKLFSQQEVKLMRDLKIPTAVICSDLTSSLRIVRSSWNDDKERSVVQVLIDSMALPFFFRVWNDNGNPVHVDGGICSNLPSGVLLEQSDRETTEGRREHGEVFAISFQSDGAVKIKSAKDFAFALINTAIDSAIQREKTRLGERVHEIRTNLTTLAFEDALNINPSDYGSIKKRADVFFKHHAEGSEKPESSEKLENSETPEGAEKRIHQDLWKEQNLQLLETLWRVYKDQNAANNIQYRACRVTWVVRGLERAEFPDDLEYELKFRVGAEPLQCQAMGVQQTGATFLGKLKFSMFDATSKKAVPYETVPARDPSAPLTRWLLFHYLPALAAGSGPFSLSFRDAIKDGSKVLLDEKEDTFNWFPDRADGNVGLIELILRVPEKRAIGYEYLPGCAEKAEEMGEADFLDAKPLPGYKCIGWRVRDWPGDQVFGVKLSLR